MAVPPITWQISYVKGDGKLTNEGLILLEEMRKSIVALEAKLEAIAAVTGPTGGSTVDAEARTAINAIITASS